MNRLRTKSYGVWFVCSNARSRRSVLGWIQSLREMYQETSWGDRSIGRRVRLTSLPSVSLLSRQCGILDVSTESFLLLNCLSTGTVLPSAYWDETGSCGLLGLAQDRNQVRALRSALMNLGAGNTLFIIIYFKLRVGFHPVAVALQNDTQIKHNTQIKHIANRIQITYTSNTQNNKNTKHTHQI
jgi:hypothetical protein